jgi:2',3'-cyclic-nucleotide 2'-phosphodiesterase (5'-nucleotidase family)
MKLFKLVSVKIALVLLASLLVFGCASLPEVEDTTLTIVHTNDTHGRVLEGKYDGMGFAKIAVKVANLRAANPNLLLLDAGDTFHGTTLASLSRGESITKVMNYIGYDAQTAGNHDFNYGYERLIELDGLTNHSVLTSNVVDASGESILPPYVIKNVNGLLVGIFGITTPETTYKTHPKNVEGLTFKEPVEVAAEMVAELESKVHVIIALVHLGVDEDETKEEWRGTYIAEHVPGIDLVVDGHSHTALEEGIRIGNTLVVQSGSHDKNLGIVTLNYSEGMVTTKAELFTKDEAANFAQNIGLLSLIDEIDKENKKITEVIVGNSDVVLDGERDNVRTRSTNMGVFITDALLAETGADFALQNGGGIRTSIDAGPVTRGEVITVLPFGNTVVVKEITGQMMVDIIENGISSLPGASGAYSHVGGLNYTFDVTKEPGSRVLEVLVDGSPIDLNKNYSLATNDFLAAGGDNYKMLVGTKSLAELGTLDDVFIDHLNSY